jgi:hypothetical protein
MGIVKDNVFYMMYKFQLVLLMPMKITNVLVKLVFFVVLNVSKLKKEQRLILSKI